MAQTINTKITRRHSDNPIAFTRRFTDNFRNIQQTVNCGLTIT